MNHTDKFLDLEIRIHPRRDAAYLAEIALGSGQEFQGHLFASILPCTSGCDPVKNGQKLFGDLFADRALRTAWDRALGQSLQRRIRLRIAADAPELHALPGHPELPPVDYKWLRDMERKGIPEFLPPGLTEPLSVRHLLDGVEPPSTRLAHDQDRSPPAQYNINVYNGGQVGAIGDEPKVKGGIHFDTDE